LRKKTTSGKFSSTKKKIKDPVAEVISIVEEGVPAAVILIVGEVLLVVAAVKKN